MIFTETKLKGSYIVEIEKNEDERGFFARTWDENEFQKNSMNSKFIQCSISYNKKRGTLRGMHFQKKPYEESKLVSCKKGSIFDVIIDLRPNSETFTEWFGVELNSRDYKSVFVPEGFAHGFQSIEDESEVFYQITNLHMPSHSSGVRWNDSKFGIKWPIDNPIISKRDLEWDDFTG